MNILVDNCRFFNQTCIPDCTTKNEILSSLLTKISRNFQHVNQLHQINTVVEAAKILGDLFSQFLYFIFSTAFLQMHVKQFFAWLASSCIFFYHRFGFLKSWVACNNILKMATNIFTKWNITTIDKKLKIYKIHIIYYRWLGLQMLMQYIIFWSKKNGDWESSFNPQ